MLRIKFGDRQWRFDESAPMSLGDVVAMREMGLEPDRFEGLIRRIGGVAADPSAMSDADSLEVAQAVAQLAYLAAVREDHELRWRHFVWSIPLDDLQAFDLADEPDEPAAAPPAVEPVTESAVGAALAEVGAVKPRKPRARKT